MPYASVFHLVSAVSYAVTSYKEFRGGWANVYYIFFVFASYGLVFSKNSWVNSRNCQNYYILARIIAINPVNPFQGM